MSITKLIKRVTVQTAVYWGGPTNDGYGSYTYSDIRDIKVRWEDTNEIITVDKGVDSKEVVSSAKVLVREDLSSQGWLYLGSVDDFASGVDYSNPKTVSGAYPIIKISKVPMIRSTTEFVRTVYL